MNELEYNIRQLVDKVPVIPPSRGYWVNRTEQGTHYETFKEKGIIGLGIDEIKLSDIVRIKEESTLRRNSRVDKDKAHAYLSEHFRKIYQRRIRESQHNKYELAKLNSEITRKTNQVHKFVFETKKNDYVVIPSEKSELITIGKIETNFLENSGYLPLQRKVVWMNEYRKFSLHPVLFKAFHSHLAFYDVSKYRDVILRTLYDFYLEGDDGNVVINLGYDGKIPFNDEIAFLYQFNHLFQGYLQFANLSYDIDNLGTIVNLNSRGKRALFGTKELAFVAAMFFLTALEGDTMDSNNYNTQMGTLVSSINDYLDSTSSDSINKAQFVNSSLKMKADPPKKMKEIIERNDRSIEGLENFGDEISEYY